MDKNEVQQKSENPRNMRFWLAAAGVGVLLLFLSNPAGMSKTLGFLLIAVGIGGALWDLATRYDKRR